MTSTLTSDDVLRRAAVQRRTLWVLVSGQMLGGIGIGIGMTVAVLLAEEISGSAGLGGLAFTAALIGSSLIVVPISRISAARGRRSGLSAGFLIGAAGAAVAVAAAGAGSYPLLLLGMVAFGGAMAAGFQSRFAAVDLADPAKAGRSLSVVVWATTVGAVSGPNLAGPAGGIGEALGVPALAGAFVWAGGSMLLAALVIFVFLRPDPLLLARRDVVVDQDAPAPSLRTSLAAVRASTSALVGIAAVAVSFTVMVSVMTMTPVHIHDGGGGLGLIGFVLSVHIGGMYALAPVVGWLADRYGTRPVLVLAVLVLGASLALAGTAGPHDAGRLAAGLFLLGFGWSCGLIAGSILLAQSVGEAVRPGVEGAADLVMTGSGAVGSALGGVVVALAGYPTLALLAALPVLLLALGVASLRRRPSVLSPE